MRSTRFLLRPAPVLSGAGHGGEENRRACNDSADTKKLFIFYYTTIFLNLQ